MEKIVIEGGKRLRGELTVQGAKNSALPILAATILVGRRSILHNCPKLTDINATVKILQYLGCTVVREGHSIAVDPAGLDRFDIPDSLMREMRSSVVFLGPILARMGRAELSTPGGCEIGLRPIDLHLSAMRQFGVQIEEEHGRLVCTCPDGLKGAHISLSFPSVGATENIMLAAATARGSTTLINAAREPEISDLADFLNGCGAHIHGAGEGTILIDGVKSLGGTEHTVIPDRIAAATYMCAAAVTHGHIILRDIIPAHLGPAIPTLEEAGCDISISARDLSISAPPRLRRIPTVRTMPYPGFPTDAQAPLMAVTSIADGTSMFVENIFESRYKHVSELMRLGARIKVEGRVAIVEGVPYLSGAHVVASDLRGGSALIVAGLSAYGMTEVTQVQLIDRGYEEIEKSLGSIGAQIKRDVEYGEETYPAEPIRFGAAPGADTEFSRRETGGESGDFPREADGGAAIGTA